MEFKIYPYDLSDDLTLSPLIRELVMDKEFAGELYSALCNMRWWKFPEDAELATIHALMKGSPEDFESDKDCLSYSWRTAGGIVADLRNPGLRKKGGEPLEGYMDWYCHGNEGLVSEKVADELSALGWRPIDWPRDNSL